MTKVESGFSSVHFFSIFIRQLLSHCVFLRVLTFQAYIDALQGLGQEFEIVDSVGSVSTGIERQGKRIQANSDFRKNGGFPAGR